MHHPLPEQLLQSSYITVSEYNSNFKIIETESNGSEINLVDNGSLPLSFNNAVVHSQWAMSWSGA